MPVKLCRHLSKSSWGITREFYEEKLNQYDVELSRIKVQLAKVEKVDKDFYLTAGYIIALVRHGAELFKRSEPEERRLLIKTILPNATWDGEKLHYEYLSPFDLLVQMNERPIWGGLWGSNPRPSGPQPDALPTELRPPRETAKKA